MATRTQLNEQAVELGIENPESYGTKAELQEAMNAVDTSVDETAPEPTEEVAQEEEVAEDGTTRDEAVVAGKSTAAKNIEKERAENQLGE